MKTIIFKTMFLLLFLILPSQLTAQYWGERVMEKGFEQTDFFFMPSNLIPYGIGSFKSTLPGLIDDPLSNLAVNPAYLRVDSLKQGYFYADFRSARMIADRNPNYVMPWVSSRSTDMYVRPYPWFYANVRRELEPVFSGACLGPVFPETLPNLVAGISYQLLLQDDKYYNVPQDIYRSVMGEDYAGNKAAAESSLPIVDKYSGQDNMHQQGHFINVFGSYEFPTIARFGIKLGRVIFDRSGSIGSSDLWDGYSGGSTSLWSNLESRSQNYEHWEFTGGSEIFLNEKTTVSATAGWLWGNATQVVHHNDSSYYGYPSTYNSSLYVSSGNTYQDWQHDGKTLLLGAGLTSHLTARHTFQILYKRMQSTIDIGLGTNILDTSYSTYSYTYLDTLRTSTSYYFLRDHRSGSGQQVTTTNRVSISFQWQIDERTHLALGIQVDNKLTETNTSESVLSRMSSVYQSYYGGYNYISENDQSKYLDWTFNVRRTSIQIPVFLTIKASDAIGLIFGLNRAMTQTVIEDVTLALFRYRQSNYNGTITRQENFGERYSTPREDISDVQTTFLAGITASPSRHFLLRLLVVPNFIDTFEGSEISNLQWWISMNVIP